MTNPTVTYHPNGNKKSEIYYLKGKFHNENGPVRIFYFENGNKQEESYYLNDQVHNINGPAEIYYYSNGNKKSEYYYVNGLAHNENGPAEICYNKNGDKQSEFYWLNGKYLNNVHSLEQLENFKLKQFNNNKPIVKDIKNMKLFRVDIYLNHDPVTNCSPTEELLNVKEVIFTNGGHLQVIFENNSEVVYNASSWRNYVKTVKA